MAIDPTISLAVAPPQVDPLGALARGMQMKALAQQVAIGNVNEMMATRQLNGMYTYADALKANSAAAQQMNDDGTPMLDASGQPKVRWKVDDAGVAQYMTQHGYPDFGEAHMERATKQQEAENNLALSKVKMRQIKAGIALSHMDAFQSSPEMMGAATPGTEGPPQFRTPDQSYAPTTPPVFGQPNMQPGTQIGAPPQPFTAPSLSGGSSQPVNALPRANVQQAVSPESQPDFTHQMPQTALPPPGPIAQQPQQVSGRLQARYSAMLHAMSVDGIDTSDFPTKYTPGYVDAARQRVSASIMAMQSAQDPLGAASKQAEIEKNLAQASQARAEAGWMGQFGKMPPEQAVFFRKFGQDMLGGKGIADFTAQDMQRAMQAYKVASEDPQTRALMQANQLAMLSQRQFQNAMQALLQKQMSGTSGPDWSQTAETPDKSDPQANVVHKEWGGMTPNELYQETMNYLSGGAPPSVGMAGNPIRLLQANAVKYKAAAIASEAGMTESEIRAMFTANKQSLTNQVKFYDSASAFLRTADQNSALLDKVLPKVGDIGSPVFNQPIRLFQRNVAGDSNLSQFATYLTSVQNEYGKILNNPNLQGQLTDEARREAQELVRPDATVHQIVGSLQALRAEGTNRLKSIGQQIGDISQRLGKPTAAGGGFNVEQPPDVNALPPNVLAAYNSGKVIVSPSGGRWKKGPNGPIAAQ